MKDILAINDMEFKFSCDVTKLQNKIDSLLILLKLSDIKYRFDNNELMDGSNAYFLDIMNSVSVFTGENIMSANLHVRSRSINGYMEVIKFVVSPSVVTGNVKVREHDYLDIDGMIVSIDELIEKL